MKILLYGANGFTGRLIAEQQKGSQHQWVLGGRNESAIAQMAEALGLEAQVFDLSSVDVISHELQEIDLVLNCAGPFIKTALPLVQACLRSHTHYLDITGEIEVFEKIRALDRKAREAGIVLLPGVGFDVVPTDAMAVALHKKAPDADFLELAFATMGSSISHGTMKTAVMNLGQKGVTRRDGKLRPESMGKRGKEFSFRSNSRFAMTIPWGDLSTAWHSTQIPNIDVYMAASRSLFNKLKWQWLWNPILRLRPVKNRMLKYVDEKIFGPSEEEREKGQAVVLGKVFKGGEQLASASLKTPETYRFTVISAITFAESVLEGSGAAGYFTPAQFLAPEEIFQWEGMDFQWEGEEGQSEEPSDDP